MTVFGGAAYTGIEILWRGHSHWSMTLTGGACFAMLARIGEKMKKNTLAERCLAGSFIITVIEFAVGLLVNEKFHMNVWDYSDEIWNLKGQICARYWALWYFLTAPAMLAAQKINQALKNPRKAVALMQRVVYNKTG